MLYRSGLWLVGMRSFDEGKGISVTTCEHSFRCQSKQTNVIILMQLPLWTTPSFCFLRVIVAR
jgi:hypothetical protein